MMSLKVNQEKVNYFVDEERWDNVFIANKRNSSVRLIDMTDEKPPELQGSETPFDDAIILTI